MSSLEEWRSKGLSDTRFQLGKDKHIWKVACSTPSGGLAGGDDVYVCTQCGMETLEPYKYVVGCPNPNGEKVTCPSCSPHPKHPSGKCRFACGCKAGNEDRYLGGTPA